MSALTFNQARAVITEKMAALAPEPSREIVRLDDALSVEPEVRMSLAVP